MLTVNLSQASVNGGQPGVIPGTVTIYVRAHINFSGGSVPAEGASFPFSTNVNATLANIGYSSAAGSATLTELNACVNGN